MFDGDKIIGVCIYTGFPVPELVVGMFGLPRDDQEGFFELSRLVLDPNYQNSIHNLAGWFLSKTIRLLRKETYVRALLSYADNDFHEGVVYKATNWLYCGLSDLKKDFYILQDDGSYKKHQRGKTKEIAGEWRKRSQKHRFVKVFDKSLKLRW